MDWSAFEQRLRKDGYTEILTRDMDPGTHNAEHSHDFDVAAMVIDGEITITCDGASRTYRAGDAFSMSARTIHAEAVGPQGVRYIVGRRS